MILVDTSVWVDHLRVGVPALAEQLEARKVAVHAWIVGERHSLMGRGIGYVDAALISSCLLSGLQLWTRDRRLAAVAGSMDLAWCPSG